MHRFISLPAYDRRLHDPVADAIQISPETQVVLVEGNFLLSDRIAVGPGVAGC